MPAFLFYPGDWKKDPQLSKCSLATRGAWIELLCAMHDNGRSGIITGTMLELAQMCRCDARQMRQALYQLSESKTAFVTLGDGRSNAQVTVVNRRMQREHKLREQTKIRMKRLRERKPLRSRARSVQISSSSSSSSFSKEKGFDDECDAREREVVSSALSHGFTEEFFDTLQERKCYQHIDVRNVYEKFKTYFEVEGRTGKPEHFIGWLNREIPNRKEVENDDRGTSAQAIRVAASLKHDN